MPVLLQVFSSRTVYVSFSRQECECRDESDNRVRWCVCVFFFSHEHPHRSVITATSDSATLRPLLLYLGTSLMCGRHMTLNKLIGVAFQAPCDIKADTHICVLVRLTALQSARKEKLPPKCKHPYTQYVWESFTAFYCVAAARKQDIPASYVCVPSWSLNWIPSFIRTTDAPATRFRFSTQRCQTVVVERNFQLIAGVVVCLVLTFSLSFRAVLIQDPHQPNNRNIPFSVATNIYFESQR